MRKLLLRPHRWPFAKPLMISRGAIVDAEVVMIEVSDDTGRRGRGEAYGITYCGETPARMIAALEAVRPEIEAGADRTALLSLLPPGGARCGLDAALWDLEAKSGHTDPFTAYGLQPAPVVSGVTIGMGSADYVTAEAAAYAGYALLKLKVGAADPLVAIDAARQSAPDARFIVDPNQAWSVEQLKALAPQLVDRGVVLLEQPIAVGGEPGLDGYICPVPLCADELINDAADLVHASGRFQVINIKLEKAGGLTAAMQLADTAIAQGFGLMVGCMGGSSLGMAPGMVLAQRCSFVDLDGPSSLVADIEHGFVYADGLVTSPHVPALWG